MKKIKNITFNDSLSWKTEIYQFFWKKFWSMDFWISMLTLRRPKQHGPQAPDVAYLAQTVKSWSYLFKIFTKVFVAAWNRK